VNISPSTTPAPAHCLKMREPLTLGTRPFLFHLLFLDSDFIIVHHSSYPAYDYTNLQKLTRTSEHASISQHELKISIRSSSEKDSSRPVSDRSNTQASTKVLMKQLTPLPSYSVTLPPRIRMLCLLTLPCFGSSLCSLSIVSGHEEDSEDAARRAFAMSSPSSQS
jgi:hypothetical protein